MLTLLLPGMIIVLSSNQSQLILKEKATVWDERIMLKDLVSTPQNLPDELANLIIGASPEPGHSEIFSSTEIQQKLLANQFNIDTISGAKQIQVQRIGSEIEPRHFLTDIKTYISSRIPAQERLNVEVTSNQSISAPKNLNWRILPAKGQDFIGTILFSLEGIDPENGRVSLQRWINVRVSREAHLAVSNRSLRSGEEIREDDVRFEWREMSPSTLNAFTKSNPPFGRRAERQIPANQIISPVYIRQDYLVLRGVSATLIARSNGVCASTPVQVLENGIQGQWVLIQNPRSSKNFRAKVCGKNQLEVVIQ